MGLQAVERAAPGWALGLDGQIARHLARERDLAACHAALLPDGFGEFRALAGACLARHARLPSWAPPALHRAAAQGRAWQVQVDLLAAAAAQAQGLDPGSGAAAALFERAAALGRDIVAAVLGPADLPVLVPGGTGPAVPATGREVQAALSLDPPGEAAFAAARSARELAYGDAAAMARAVSAYLDGPLRAPGVDRVLLAMLADQRIVARLAALRLPQDGGPLSAARRRPARAAWWPWAVAGLVALAAGLLAGGPVPLALAVAAPLLGWAAARRAAVLADPAARRLLAEEEALVALQGFLHGEGLISAAELRERLAGIALDWPPVLRVLLEDLAARAVMRL